MHLLADCNTVQRMMALQHVHSIPHSVHFCSVMHITPVCCPFGQIPLLLAEKPISVLDKQYEEVAEFLGGYSGIHDSIEELSVSHELVNWLKEAMKGIL